MHIPLVADMHFNRKAAMIACEAYDKIRVNPGNFADGRKTFEEIDYDVRGGVRCFTRAAMAWEWGAFLTSRRRAGTPRRVDGVGCHRYAVAATQHTLSSHVASMASRWTRRDAVGARATHHAVAINTGPEAVRGRARLHRGDVHALGRTVQGIGKSY